jgi:LacI family transcriptional regulator
MRALARSAPATLRDVALALGISASTVSRALNDRPGLSLGVREQVRETARRLGYRPSGIARALRSNVTRTLGLVLPSLLNPFFTELAHAAELAARTKGFSLIIGNSDEDPDVETEYLRVMIERGVDGMLIAPSRDQNDELEQLHASGVRMVFLDRSIADLDVPTVEVDATKAIKELAAHFAAMGHRRIGVILGPQDVAIARRRAQEFIDAGKGVGLQFRSKDQVFGNFTASGGAAAFETLANDPPDAVFCTNNLMTQGFLLAATNAGATIGHDIAIASFDDLPLFELYNPSITAIVQPTRSIGTAAVDLLLRRMAGENVASIRFEAKLAYRSSCNRRPTRARDS